MIKEPKPLNNLTTQQYFGGAKFLMTPSARLGGFKVLKDVVRISPIFPEQSEYLPAMLCRVIAEEKINLPYITCVNIGHAWGLNVVVDSFNGEKTSRLIEKIFGKVFSYDDRSVILSIFPHKKDPIITGSLFEVFGQEGLEADALANSPSAISVVFKEELLNRASNALFGPFSFGAYRTPADWKLAQKGKEQLYKEVVASYQEQRPKVYGLEVQDGQELLRLELNNRHSRDIGAVFKDFARLGLHLTFLTTGPCQERGNKIMVFCLPLSSGQSYERIIKEKAPNMETTRISPVATFSMNGPHFGDRYGIASELVNAFESSSIQLLGLNCTISSITGVVPAEQIDSAIQAIQHCFEVPSIMNKGSH